MAGVGSTCSCSSNSLTQTWVSWRAKWSGKRKKRKNPVAVWLCLEWTEHSAKVWAMVWLGVTVCPWWRDGWTRALMITSKDPHWMAELHEGSSLDGRIAEQTEAGLVFSHWQPGSTSVGNPAEQTEARLVFTIIDSLDQHRISLLQNRLQQDWCSQSLTTRSTLDVQEQTAAKVVFTIIDSLGQHQMAVLQNRLQQDWCSQSLTTWVNTEWQYCRTDCSKIGVHSHWQPGSTPNGNIAEQTEAGLAFTFTDNPNQHWKAGSQKRLKQDWCWQSFKIPATKG